LFLADYNQSAGEGQHLRAALEQGSSFSPQGGLANEFDED